MTEQGASAKSQGSFISPPGPARLPARRRDPA